MFPRLGLTGRIFLRGTPGVGWDLLKNLPCGCRPKMLEYDSQGWGEIHRHGQGEARRAGAPCRPPRPLLLRSMEAIIFVVTRVAPRAACVILTCHRARFAICLLPNVADTCEIPTAAPSPSPAPLSIDT